MSFPTPEEMAREEMESWTKAETGAAVETPAPGIYEGVPFETYLAWDACSASRLKKLALSPAHCFHSFTDPDEPSSALEIGTALHTAILEPEAWGDRYYPCEKVDKRTTVGKQRYAEQLREAGSRMLITHEDAALVKAVREQVHKCNAARELLDGATKREVSLVWIDPETGILCKGRLDLLQTEPCSIVSDLKSALSARRSDYQRAVVNFGYDKSGAHYLDGLAVLGLPAEMIRHIVIEKKPPYGVAVYRLSDIFLEIGRAQISALKRTYADCLSSGIWPGYPDVVQELEPPPWYAREHEDAVSGLIRSAIEETFSFDEEHE